MSEREKAIHDPEEDAKRVVTHFKVFLLNIHPEGFPDSHAQKWREMVDGMFREPTPDERVEAKRWGSWHEERLAHDITPQLLQAYHQGWIWWMRTRFVQEALQRPDFFQFSAQTPQYMQAVMNYEFPQRLFGEDYPIPPKSPLVP